MLKLYRIIRNRIMSYNLKDYRISIMVIAILLGVIGSVTLYFLPGMPQKLYLKQLGGIAAGVAIAIFVSAFDYRFIAKFWIPMYALNFLMLFAVRYTRFGVSQYGARRWLGYEDVFQFQPSELSKVIMIVVMAKVFQLFSEKLNKIWVLPVVAGVFAIPVFFIFKQPDLSTTIVFVVLFVVILFASGYNIKVLLFLFILTVPLAIFAFWYIQQPNPKFITTVQQNRVLAWLHPEEYVDEMYQQLNSVSAISSGGLLGKKLTNDTSPRGVVPKAESDFIFSGICEEFGFLGGLTTVVLYILLAFIIIRIAINAVDLLGKLIAIGCATVIFVQACVNIGVVTLLLPNTGIPLPFISNGLSSVLSSYIMLGLVENVSVNHTIMIRKESEDYIR